MSVKRMISTQQLTFYQIYNFIYNLFTIYLQLTKFLRSIFSVFSSAIRHECYPAWIIAFLQDSFTWYNSLAALAHYDMCRMHMIPVYDCIRISAAYCIPTAREAIMAHYRSTCCCSYVKELLAFLLGPLDIHRRTGNHVFHQTHRNTILWIWKF